MAVTGSVPAQRGELDVIAIGRVSVDLYGQQIGSRLEDIQSFAKSVGGCPANIAIGAARLGLKSGIVTRVGDEQMGRFVLEQLAREGVALSGDHHRSRPAHRAGYSGGRKRQNVSAGLLPGKLRRHGAGGSGNRSRLHRFGAGGAGDRDAFLAATYACGAGESDRDRAGKRP